MFKESKRIEQGQEEVLREMVFSAVRYVKESGYRFKALGMLDEVAGLIRGGNGSETSDRFSQQETVGRVVNSMLDEMGQKGFFRAEFYVWNHERGDIEVKVVRISR